MDEKCICKKTSKVLCEVDKKFFRPSDVTYLRGDYSKINQELGWKPETAFETMAERMVLTDIQLVESGNTYSF